MDIWKCVFLDGGKPENPEKNPRNKASTKSKLNPLMTPGTGIEPGPHVHGWEASALTTPPSLLPHKKMMYGSSIA